MTAQDPVPLLTAEMADIYATRLNQIKERYGESCEALVAALRAIASGAAVVVPADKGRGAVDLHGANFLAGARMLAEEHTRSFAIGLSRDYGQPGKHPAEVIGLAALDMQLLAERVARLYAAHPPERQDDAVLKDAERWREVERNPFTAVDRILAAINPNEPSATWRPSLRAAFDAALASQSPSTNKEDVK